MNPKLFKLLNRLKLIHRQKSILSTRIAVLIQNLRPVMTDKALIRIGSAHDGGYLVPNDFEGIAACFSPGVSDNVSFEADLMKKYAINSHLADFSVDSVPDQFNALSFEKKFLGAYDDATFMTLESWISTRNGLNRDDELILQMDIEGAENEVLLSTSEATLSRFRILIIEIHKTASWENVQYFSIVETVLKKLLKQFAPVHIHPNNAARIVNVLGMPVPKTFEVTFLRRDRARIIGPATRFPHPLDACNVKGKPDIVLPPEWYLNRSLGAE